MKGLLRFDGVRSATALFAVLTALSIGLAAGSVMADEVGGEDIVVPPPADPAPPPAPPEEDKFKLYLSGIAGYSWAKGDAGGHNNCCEFDEFRNRTKNDGSDWDSTAFGGGALGLDAELENFGVRFEIEGQAARGYDMKTKGPITGEGPFHISSNSWAMFANVFLDIPIAESFDFYLGGGVGIGVHDVRVNYKNNGGAGFQVKSKNDNDANWAVQAGAGFSYDVFDLLTLDLGYRYLTFGDIEVDLAEPIGGDYKLDIHSHDLILGIRINYYSF
jgi:opacity protein-like surface antigen